MSGIQRVNGQFQCMSPAVCCSRLRRIQSLLWNGESRPDAILCSLGIDSRYNEGCSELANYLFYGLYRKNQLNLEHILDDFPEEVLDDVIVLIKAESVHLYCNPINYRYLLPYIAQWRNLTIHCLTQTEYEDEEVAEEFKISSFVNMVQDCSSIGVPYSSQGHIQKFDMFMMEKWPIIQAFALDGIGRGCFFTMKYKLMDISEQLWQIYTRLDPVSLDTLLTEDLVLFEKQWSSFFSSFDIESHLSILELSEAQAGEAFRTYFSHGLISSNIADSSKSRQPLVLFGSHSSMENLQSYSFNFPSDGHQVRNTGPQGGPAKHMVLQCVAPKGFLACSRTYFFGTTHIPYLVHKNNKCFKSEPLLLSQIYAAAIQSVLAGIKCYSNTSSVTKAKDVAEHTFQLTLASFHLAQYKTALRSKSVFNIQAVNNEGRIVPLSKDESRFLVKTASMSVYDIPDLLWGEGDLGSVVFSESFLESSINIQQKVDQLIKSTLDSLCLYLQGKMSFFSAGILFLHPQYGSITLPTSLISKINIVSSYLYFSLSQDSNNLVAALFVEYEAALLPHLPFPLHSDDRCLVFSLQPGSESHRAFYSQVLPVWQGSDSGLSLQLMDREQFLQHFALSSVGQEPIRNDHLGALFPTPDISNPLVVITILSGLPGSHRDRLADFLVQLNREGGRWVVYQSGPGSPLFSASHLQRYLSCFLEKQRSPGGKPRLLLLTPGCTDVLDVVQAVLSHPDQVVQSCFTIGAVTACVDPLSSYMEHRLVFPKLMEQCSQGIVSTVVFTGPTAERNNPVFQNIQQLIRSANPNAAFVHAERGAVTRNEDVTMILSENSFSEAQMLRARYLLYPGWCQGRFCTGSGSISLTQQSVVFSRPLERALFLTRCKGINITPVTEILHVPAVDSEKMMEVSYSAVSGNLTVSQQQGDPPQGDQEASGCFLLFHVMSSHTAYPSGFAVCLTVCVCVQVKRHLDPLPPGFFYNGHQYVSFFGEKKNFHPHMEQFIEEYVEEGNRQIDLFNHQLEQQNYQDLFDP
uniref:Uncharacterized protein n=1 Tax=Esox lucius TaxID=8010 RepID=A0AAY5KLS7_ESOLU